MTKPFLSGYSNYGSLDMTKQNEFTNIGISSYSQMDIIDNGHPKKKVYHVTPKGVFAYIFLTIVLAGTVGLIVYFTHPARGTCKCEEPTPIVEKNVETTKWGESDWEKCVNMSRSRGECLPVESCLTTTQKPIETTPAPIKSSESWRIPTHFIPSHYDIELKPDIYTANSDNFSFTGHVFIHLKCDSSNDTIFVHYRKMTMNKNETRVIDVDSGDDLDIASQNYDEEPEFFKIQLNELVSDGTLITVYLEFDGPLARDMEGMYWSSYGRGDDVNYMIATQLESTDARKAFPCLDEPQLRATFNVTLLRKEPKHSQSNSPKYDEEDRGDGWIADKFEKTNVTMPVYLLAFAVSDQKSVKNEATGGLTTKPLEYWSRPEYIDAGYMNHTFAVSPPMFDFFEVYFDHPFNMPKTDMITITDFAAGAMENWGLITYRESRLLDDARHSRMRDIQHFTGTIAHELLHMWLGNVVTCRWWSEIWLQEGGSRFFQQLAVQDTMPTWNMTHTYLAQVVYRVLHVDDSGTQHPLHNPVYTPSEIDSMFSSITYDKGSAFIRMAEKLMFRDSDSFRDAYREYVDKMQYDGAMYNDLFESWDKQAAADGIQLERNFSVWGDTWIKQMGYPVLYFEKEGNDQIKVTQKNFLEYPDKPIRERYPSIYNYKWEVPFMYITEDDGEPTLEWIHQNQNTTTFKLSENMEGNDWFLGNYFQYGFFRANYEPNLWRNIKAQLDADHEVFDIVHRGQIIDDSLSLAKAGEMNQTTALEMTEYLIKDQDYLPWYAAEYNLDFIDDMLYLTSGYGDYRTYMRNLVKPHYEFYGWNFNRDDALTESYQRALMIDLACRYDITDCVTEAKSLFDQYNQDSDNFDIIVPDFRSTVYCISIRDGPDYYWDFMFDLYVNVDHEMERAKLRDSLACSDQLWRLSAYFQMAINNDDRLFYSDRTSVLRAVSRNRIARPYVWQYLNANWKTMPSRTTILSEIASKFSTEFQLQEFDNFVTNNPAEDSSTENIYASLRYVIQHNIRWKDQNLDSVFTWVKEAIERQS